MIFSDYYNIYKLKELSQDKEALKSTIFADEGFILKRFQEEGIYPPKEWIKEVETVASITFLLRNYETSEKEKLYYLDYFKDDSDFFKGLQNPNQMSDDFILEILSNEDKPYVELPMVDVNLFLQNKDAVLKGLENTKKRDYIYSVLLEKPEKIKSYPVEFFKYFIELFNKDPENLFKREDLCELFRREIKNSYVVDMMKPQTLLKYLDRTGDFSFLKYIESSSPNFHIEAYKILKRKHSNLTEQEYFNLSSVDTKFLFTMYDILPNINEKDILNYFYENAPKLDMRKYSTYDVANPKLKSFLNFTAYNESKIRKDSDLVDIVKNLTNSCPELRAFNYVIYNLEETDYIDGKRVSNLKVPEDVAIDFINKYLDSKHGEVFLLRYGLVDLILKSGDKINNNLNKYLVVLKSFIENSNNLDSKKKKEYQKVLKDIENNINPESAKLVKDFVLNNVFNPKLLELDWFGDARHMKDENGVLTIPRSLLEFYVTEIDSRTPLKETLELEMRDPVRNYFIDGVKNKKMKLCPSVFDPTSDSVYSHSYSSFMLRFLNDNKDVASFSDLSAIELYKNGLHKNVSEKIFIKQDEKFDIEDIFSDLPEIIQYLNQKMPLYIDVTEQNKDYDFNHKSVIRVHQIQDKIKNISKMLDRVSEKEKQTFLNALNKGSYVELALLSFITKDKKPFINRMISDFENGQDVNFGSYLPLFLNDTNDLNFLTDSKVSLKAKVEFAKYVAKESEMKQNYDVKNLLKKIVSLNLDEDVKKVIIPEIMKNNISFIYTKSSNLANTVHEYLSFKEFAAGIEKICENGKWLDTIKKHLGSSIDDSIKGFFKNMKCEEYFKEMEDLKKDYPAAYSILTFPSYIYNSMSEFKDGKPSDIMKDDFEKYKEQAIASVDDPDLKEKISQPFYDGGIHFLEYWNTLFDTDAIVEGFEKINKNMAKGMTNDDGYWSRTFGDTILLNFPFIHYLNSNYNNGNLDCSTLYKDFCKDFLKKLVKKDLIYVKMINEHSFLSGVYGEDLLNDTLPNIKTPKDFLKILCGNWASEVSDRKIKYLSKDILNSSTHGLSEYQKKSNMFFANLLDTIATNNVDCAKYISYLNGLEKLQTNYNYRVNNSSLVCFESLMKVSSVCGNIDKVIAATETKTGIEKLLVNLDFIDDEHTTFKL